MKPTASASGWRWPRWSGAPTWLPSCWPLPGSSRCSPWWCRSTSILRNMHQMVHHTLGDDIEVRTEIADGLWNSLVDTSQLENVILNLAINARDAMPEGGRLTISSATPMIEASITMPLASRIAARALHADLSEDTGSGMSPDLIARCSNPSSPPSRPGKAPGLASRWLTALSSRPAAISFSTACLAKAPPSASTCRAAWPMLNRPRLPRR